MNADGTKAEKPNNGSKTIWVFTPSRTDPKDLEFILVQRQELLKDAVERVRESALTDHKHHLLFVGPRGCGKTHLVTLIVDRLSKDSELTDRLRIAWLNEDETCTTLLELLLKIHSALVKRYPTEYNEDMLTAAYERKSEEALEFVSNHLLATLGSRTLLVVVENLDAIFDGLGDTGQKDLRAFIQENPKLTIVATAQRLVEDLSNRASPFFGFFQTEHLKPLNVVEATELLMNIARLQEKTGVVEFLATSRGHSRVRALHHLSGGNHRIYIVLSQFITRDSIDSLLELFMKMVDELTPYYQERIRWLPALQRKIVECLCGADGTMSVKEIARRLFNTSQTISSQLQSLRDKGYVEANQRGRESLYEISEALMRICVEVKDNQRRQPLRLLVDFLRVWYDDPELKNRLGKMGTDSACCAYLESALQRNSIEGNLRKKILLEELQFSLSRKMKPSQWEDFVQELTSQPEAIALSATYLSEGNKTEARRCLDEAIAVESTPLSKAELLLFSAALYSGFKESQNEIRDYTAVIGIANAPVDLVAKALLYRGITYGQAGETQLEITDYAAVIGLANAPVKYVAVALANRGIIHGQAEEVQLAMADYTTVIELANAPIEQVAKALVNRGITHGKAGETQLEIADYSAVIGLVNAPVEQVAKALACRGITHGHAGRPQLAITDYTTVIGLPNTPVELVTKALICRGIAHGQTGENQLAITDFTHVIGDANATVQDVAIALVYRGVAHSQREDTQLAIADYSAVIGLANAPVEQIAMALVYRGVIHGKTGETQREIADYTEAIGLSGAPAEQVAIALTYRGITYGQEGATQLQIADYTAVIGLSGAPVEEVANAFYSRGVIFFKESRKEEAQSDFEAVLCLPDAPPKKLVDSHVALTELHFDEGKWMEGFQALEAGLECGAKIKPPYHETAEDLVGVVFAAGLNPEGRREKVQKLVASYQKYQALPVLGEGIVKHIGEVFKAGEPYPSADNLEGWAKAWEQAAESVPEFRLSIRLLRTGVNFVKAGGKDRGILLDLTSTERNILEQALGLAAE